MVLKTLIPTIAIGSIPNLSGTAAESNIKSKSITGFGKIAATYPVRGKIKGTTMVFKSLGKLKKKGKKLL